MNPLIYTYYYSLSSKTVFAIVIALKSSGPAEEVESLGKMSW